MTEYEVGYLQALQDVQIAVRQMVNNQDASPEGKVALLGVVSLLEGLIKEKIEQDGDHDDQAAPDPLSGSF
ncbi:MAG: hypothetical protein K2Y56_19100 [Methylobacterium sp.]|uniref:hypothetical protein n=1 Tax=Methylobacterium sp. TaxID=409 RepID=UPI0025F6F33D|nr:hypothetical protein [Methylobacterium sp.]MBX9933597.1 hypothetical protein [Methylobacterium sp.]